MSQLIALAPDLPDEMRIILLNIDEAGRLADFAASSLNLDVAQRQALLEELDVVKRLRAVQERVSAQLEIAHIQEKLHKDVEKLAIATNYLVKRQLKENGLQPEQCAWESAALQTIIEDYTRESGVRELERQIGAVCRGVAAQVARGECNHIAVTPEVVRQMLGAAKYVRETRLKTSRPGVVTGLAYTPAGGEVLFIETARYSGTGQIKLTGQIGSVMKESAEAALSLVRSRVSELGIAPDAFKTTDIHIHVPSGAVPKDGPSAGIAMFTALASVFTNTPVRATVAMTGELTLRGLVLPIGGLKEKALAAMRAGIEQIIIPKLNEKDIPDLPEEIKQRLKFTPVETVDEVLAAALEEHSEREKAVA